MAFEGVPVLSVPFRWLCFPSHLHLRPLSWSRGLKGTNIQASSRSFLDIGRIVEDAFLSSRGIESQLLVIRACLGLYNILWVTRFVACLLWSCKTFCRLAFQTVWQTFVKCSAGAIRKGHPIERLLSSTSIEMLTTQCISPSSLRSRRTSVTV